ncbi:MAG: outer membrane lipoprotein-sorting protein [Deltaproteobacteria bacterium]|nr:outer membrane lipoprotein-sorting protein [Deltaproteobacteria bacterium]
MKRTFPHPAPGRRLGLAVALGALVLLAAPARAEVPDIDTLLKKADDVSRGESSQGVMVMHIKTKHWERNLEMEVASKGTEKTLMKILSPAKEKGTTTLKVEDNIWNYLPKVDRTIKVPASMMSGSWMGSHFTNDDLVKESRYTDDFACAYVSHPEKVAEGHGVAEYVIDCKPNENAAVVWGKVRIFVDQPSELITKAEFFDEKGELVRTMTYSEVKEMGGRKLPTVMTLKVADKPEEYTEVIFKEIVFDVDIPDRTFSLQALKR